MTSLQPTLDRSLELARAHLHAKAQGLTIECASTGTAVAEQRVERRILLIAPDTDLCASTAEFLLRSDFFVRAVHDGTRGLAECLEGNYNLIVVDADIAVLGGTALLQELRSRSLVPVLFIGEREEQCINGLEAGADDFILKPFRLTELATRLYGVLRRSDKVSAEIVQFFQCGELSVNTRTHQAFFRDEPIALTNVEFSILKCLIRCEGRIVSRDELAAVLYQRKSTPFERSIDVHISHLRRKIEEAGTVSIRTIRGVGYLLAACVAIGG